MFKKVMNMLTGKPLPNEQTSSEKYNVPFGLAVMASDAISSVAYAGEEILSVLLLLGIYAYTWLGYIAFAIVGLLALVTISYMQVIKAYPQGGGAYIVAKENINVVVGLVAGSGLIISYVLTVAVSASAGVSAIISAFPQVMSHRTSLAIFLIVILTILNLRGVGESSKIFSIPTYIFIFSMLFMIIYGVVKHAIDPSSIVPATIASQNLKQSQDVTMLLVLRAFAQGCSALTGVEAVSNSVPNFKEPSQKNANLVMILLALTIFIIFTGSCYVAKITLAVPDPNITVIAQVAMSLFGNSFMFYLIQASTAIILLMACNTAFTGFPMLMYVIGKDGYVPRQFTLRGKRLSFSIGIIVLSAIAILLVYVFNADVHSLLPLYSVGVFLSFTLAQLGMILHWFRTKDKGWKLRASINALGALATLLTTCIVGYEKFVEGAWIVLVLIPISVSIMLAIKKHYSQIAEQLRATKEDIDRIKVGKQFKHICVIPISSLTKATLEALQYARSISDTVIALNISTDKEAMEKLENKWKELDTDILLVSKYSTYRQVVTPLIEYIEILSKESTDDEKITVIVPQFIIPQWWVNLLHNQTAFLIRELLLQDEKTKVIVSTYPYYLEDK